MTEEIDSSLPRICRISMCPPKENTDIDYLVDNSGAFNNDSNPEYFCVEFGTQNPVIMVGVGQEINVDDVICYMRNIPVRSQMHGKITEVTSKYIIGQYIQTAESVDVEAIKTNYNL